MKLQLKHKRLIVLGVDLLLIIAVLFLIFFLPDVMELLPECILRQLGLPCLGCGGTRCIKAFIHFNFIESFMLHPFAFICILLLIYLLVLTHLAWVLGIKKAQRWFENLLHPAYSFSFLGLFVVFAILRITGLLPTP